MPNLQLDSLPLELDGTDFEVHTDGADVALSICIVRKTQQRAGLSHTAVSDQEKLEEIVVFGVHCCCASVSGPNGAAELVIWFEE